MSLWNVGSAVVQPEPDYAFLMPWAHTDWGLHANQHKTRSGIHPHIFLNLSVLQMVPFAFILERNFMHGMYNIFLWPYFVPWSPLPDIWKCWKWTSPVTAFTFFFGIWATIKRNYRCTLVKVAVMSSCSFCATIAPSQWTCNHWTSLSALSLSEANIRSEWPPHILLTDRCDGFGRLMSPNSYSCFARYGSNLPVSSMTHRKLLLCLGPMCSSCPTNDSPLSARKVAFSFFRRRPSATNCVIEHLAMDTHNSALQNSKESCQ